MKKILFILAALIFSSFSLSAQWTCKTLDPEFDNALKIAYTEMNNRAQLIMGEFLRSLDYEDWCSYSGSLDDKLFETINKISEWKYAGEEVTDYLFELDDSDSIDASKVSCVNALKSQGRKLGNIPLMLAVDHYRKLQAPYSFDISLKVGPGYNHYKSDMDFNVSYEWAENKKVGYYRIEWLSRDFWNDFKAANGVKIRIKQNRDSDYQYYEFSMSGSSKAFNFVTLGHNVVWIEDIAECFIKVFETMKAKEAQKEAERQKELEALTPPHKLKFECVEREFGFSSYDFSFYETPNELAVVCPSIRDSVFPPDHLDYNLEGDSLLMALGICSCANDIIFSENAEEFLIKTHQDSLWLYSSERERNPFDTLVSFDYFISQYKRYGKHFCGFYLQSNDGSYNDTIIPGYKVSWVQTPLRLIITTNNTVQEFYVMDWSFDKVSLFPDSYQWTYHVKSDKEDNEYKFCIWRKIIDSDSWMSDMGDEMKLNWDEFFSKNIGFKFVYIGESFNKLKITK